MSGKMGPDNRVLGAMPVPPGSETRMEKNLLTGELRGINNFDALAVALECPGLPVIWAGSHIAHIKPENREFWLLSEKDLAYNLVDGTE